MMVLLLSEKRGFTMTELLDLTEAELEDWFSVYEEICDAREAYVKEQTKQHKRPRRR